jgi:hypothetical protein
MMTLTCCVLGLCLGEAPDSDEPVRRPVRVTVAAYGKPDVGGATTVKYDPAARAWSVRDPYELPFARVRSVEVAPPAGSSGDGRVRVNFGALGEKDPDRRLLVELWVLNAEGRVLWHTWELQHDARLNKPMQIGSRIATPSLENSATFKVPQRMMPRVRAVKLQLREMRPNEWKHFPTQPSDIDLKMTRPDAEGRFELSFVNPEGNRFEPGRHRVAVSVWVGDSERKTVRMADVKETGEYRFAFRLDPKDIENVELHVAFFARQPDNAEFARQAFVDGTGSRYSGPWYGVKLPLREVAREE